MKNQKNTGKDRKWIVLIIVSLAVIAVIIPVTLYMLKNPGKKPAAAEGQTQAAAKDGESASEAEAADMAEAETGDETDADDEAGNGEVTEAGAQAETGDESETAVEETQLDEQKEAPPEEAFLEEPEVKEPYIEGTIALDPAWTFADYSVIHTGEAVLYRAGTGRRDIVIGVNAGHGTAGGSAQQTPCHPDYTPKVTGGSTAAGATYAACVSGGMTFADGTPEPVVTLREAQILRDKLLADGFDVLMIRDGDDVQLDNIARTVICNNNAACHIAIHWDGDGLGYDKGCYYMSVPEGIKYLDNVAATWEQSERLGECLISGLADNGCTIYQYGSMDIDLTQTSYSSVPSIDIELGNQSSDHSDAALDQLAEGLLNGIRAYFSES